MSPEIVRALRRPLLLSCIALALSGVASAAPLRPHMESVHVGGRRDDAAALEPHADPASTRLHPVHVESVSNCADSGPGSLRDAIAAAADGDSIDLTQLSCSTISLTTGSIHIPQNTLSLVGPGPSLSITEDAASVGRILTHTGTGTLTVAGLTISYGYEDNDGGCIWSAGNLTLSNASVRQCESGTNYSPSYNLGGGIYVTGNLTMSSSTLERNVCFSAPYGISFGGGAFVRGAANIHESTINGNVVGSSYRPGNVGGITIQGTEPSAIVNSTISGNSATNLLGGIYAYASLTLSNSTIAFNYAFNGLSAPRGPGGVQAYNGPLTMNSTIVSNNYASGSEYDLYAFGVVSGTNNLVMISSNSPPGTLTADPGLQSLADNGGRRKRMRS